MWSFTDIYRHSTSLKPSVLVEFWYLRVRMKFRPVLGSTDRTIDTPDSISAVLFFSKYIISDSLFRCSYLE